MHTLLTHSTLAILLCTAATSAAADTPVSLETVMTAASALELRQGQADEEASVFGNIRRYGNGDELIAAFDVPIVLSFCQDRGHLSLGRHLNTEAMLPGIAPTLPPDQRVGAIADISLTLLHGAATVLDIVGDELPLPPAGKSASFLRTPSSDDGDERYTVTVGHGIGGEVRVKVVNTGPVGTWYEMVVSSAPQEATVPDGMSMKGWLSPNQAQYATVGEARRATSACTPSRDASVDRPPHVFD